MALVGIELTRLREKLPQSAVDVRDQVGGIDNEVAALARDVQGISHQLHSSKLDYFGLAVAAGHFCRELSSHYDVDIDYSHENVDAGLNKDVAISLFRVLQEALSNVVKHSGARRCWVTLRGTSDEIRLHVIDDGRGFDPHSAPEGHGLGLVSMRERLRLVNGDVVIDSEPQEGTTVSARVPVPAELAQDAFAGR